jgi:5-methylcytosine-specific restriction enzyme B
LLVSGAPGDDAPMNTLDDGGLAKAPQRSLREWFADPATADACLGLLARLIEEAHALGPARWVLTLRDRRGLSLSVGAWLILRLDGDGDAVIALDEATLGCSPSELFADAAVRSLERFVKSPNVILAGMPATALATLAARLTVSIQSALTLAAQTVRRRTPFSRYHSTEAVQSVAAAVGRALPAPDYRDDDAALELVASAGSTTLAEWTDASLQRAWASHSARGDAWTEGALALVARVRDASAETFRARETQQALWGAQVFASAGPGHAIDVTAAYTDGEVLDRLEALRVRVWPSDVAACAAAIQGEFDALMARLVALGVKSRPWAKLLRTLSILLPQRLTCLLQHEARAKTVRRLFGRDRPGGAIEEQVRIRARLRDALGEETDLREHVQRVTFCWTLQESAAAIVRPTSATKSDEPRADDTSEASPSMTGPRAEPDVEPILASAVGAPLTLLPFGRQYKGMGALSRYAEAWRDLLRAAQAGQDTDAIVGEVRAQGAGASDSATALRASVSRLLGLGLLQRQGDLFRPTDEGMRVLDGEDDPLIEPLLVRAYGFAQLLRVVARRAGLTRAELYATMRDGYASWTSNFGPSGLLAWTKDLGLTEEVGGRLRLTPYGEAWHARLPEALPTPDDEGAADGDPDAGASHEIAPVPLRSLDFAAIESRLRASPAAAGFVLDAATLRALHAAWTCNAAKHFVILSGLSGTGKTAVLRHYARSVCEALVLSEARHVRLVAVSPDWHDPSGLLGYFNPLHEDPTYQVEPALRLVLEAAGDPSNPYFLILDEMNLARVERYMAPFLSAMETGGDLTLHASSVDVNGVPPRVRWPTNLFLGGTVNMDESTHPFSDKVLDRAFTLEFWSVDLPTFFERRKERHAPSEETLLALNAALEPARRHFGYRTAGEVIDFVLAMTAAGAPEADALDQAVFAKVLPKLRGEDDAALRAALDSARKVAADGNMRRSAEKLSLMRRRLEATGVTRFWS